jgi:hypothetical protein
MELFDGVCMTNERNPSIFDDRASIGSEKDLDEYGVWVKSESEEFSVPEGDDSFEADFPPFEEGQGSTDTAGHISKTKTQTNADVTLSAALFLKIAEELAAIKVELAALKSELDRIHRGDAEPAAAQASVVSAPPIPAASDISTEAEIPENKAGEDISAKAEENNVVEEAAEEAAFDDFGDFGIEESADEEPDREGVGGEEGEESAHNETAGAVFFDTEEGGDKITLTTDELDLLSESADETPEEMEDSFFADDSDEEKIAFTRDEIDTILDDTEIHDEKGDFEGFEEAVQETAEKSMEEPAEKPFDDEESVSQSEVEAGVSRVVAREEPLTEPGAAQDAEKPVEEPLIEDDVFDINVEAAEKPLSEDSLLEDEDAEITFDEEPLDIEIDDEPPEEEAKTADVADDLDIEADTKEHESIESAPETADSAFDPFGSLPDEDVLEESAAGLEEDFPADFTAEEKPSVEDSAGSPDRVEENAAAIEDDPFADFPVLEEPLAEEEPGTPTVAEESAEAAENASGSTDTFADLPPLENGDFDEPFTTDITETDQTPDALPDDISGVSEDSSDLGKDEDTIVESDPALMEILDEDLRQMSPVPDDTSYLDDEKPLALDEIAGPESPAPFEPPEPVLSEAVVPLPEEKPDTPETVPQDAESPALKGVPPAFKQELRAVLSYMDILLESLPEEKIEEFARSEHFEPYKKLFKELGLV